MASQSSKVVYEGRTLITEFDLDDLPRLEEELQDFIELEEGEQIYASIEDDSRIEVRVLEERESA